MIASTHPKKESRPAQRRAAWSFPFRRRLPTGDKEYTRNAFKMFGPGPQL
jgi:hypothetical protein